MEAPGGFSSAEEIPGRGLPLHAVAVHPPPKGAARGGPARALALAAGWFSLLIALSGLVLPPFLLPVDNSPWVAPTIVSIPAGATAASIAIQLEERGLIRSGLVFRWAAKLLGVDRALQAGDYRLWPSMSLPEVLRTIAQGAVATVVVTIPEGSSLVQIADLLDQRGVVRRERFLELASDDRLVYGETPPIPKPIASLEGYLFPDTYRFALGQDEASVIRRMVGRFLDHALPLIEQYRGAVGLSAHEVVTMASIVEKEAMVDRERPVIASVFFNRLAIGMPLQSDPTVQYLLPRRVVRLSYRELAIDSPYNTYRYPGLPPGPISSPGLASLRAVLFPARTDYLYFVARGDGTHLFSRTFNDHVRARRQVGL